MTINAPTKINSRIKALIKAAVFVFFILFSIYLVRFTPVKNILSLGVLGAYFERVGFWAPVFFMLFYAVGICLFIPGTLLTGLGAAIFGAYWG
ncbi:MAG: TVP38/TMEM64 family protein, partial [Deltaproteobacteria bacterium]|nr:TVP38/TMEM64 family protein [Deltaproteobacteria bacterium]